MYYKSEDEFKTAAGYEIDGQWFPRVTKILEIKSKPALYRYYAAAKNFEEAEAKTQKSAEEGTLVHEIVEKIMVGESPAVPPEIAPAVGAAIEFLKINDIKVEAPHVERRIINFAHRYSGTIDAMATISGKFGVLDIKTSQSIYRDYNLQTSAYMDALKREPEFAGLETRWILRIDQQKDCRRCKATLRPKGGQDKIKTAWRGAIPACPEDGHDWSELKGIVELKEFPYWREDFQAFLAAKKLWEWENEFWLRKIGYL